VIAADRVPAMRSSIFQRSPHYGSHQTPLQEAYYFRPEHLVPVEQASTAAYDHRDNSGAVAFHIAPAREALNTPELAKRTLSHD
jgi:hypothetical protein